MAELENCAPGCTPNTGTVQEIIASPCITCDDGGAGAGARDVEQIVLCDVSADGDILGTAIAVWQYDESGNPVGPPTFVNPTTGDPYVPQGTLQPCAGGSGADCGGPIQFCFTETSTGPVDHPGRMYDITLPINPGFAVESLQVDAVTNAANIIWEVDDPDGELFRQNLTTFIEGRVPAAATVTITNPNAGQVVCGTASPMTIHIECVRLDQNPPNLIELIYNGGQDMIINPAYNETPPLNPPVAGGNYGYHLLSRQDDPGPFPGNPPANDVNCTNTANRGWETNDVGRTFEIWGQDVAGGVTPTPRGTPVQEITSDGPPPGGISTIWQTFQAPASGDFIIRVVHGGRDAGENHRITLDIGDTDDQQNGTLINDVVNNIGVVYNGGPWTTFNQTIPLTGGQTYTLAISTTEDSPDNNARGGLFTDMRAYIDRPGQRATATTDDDTCVVTVEETTTNTRCEYWKQQCIQGNVVAWQNVATGQELDNAAFWGQVPAPGCCLPSSSEGEGGSVSAGNLIYNYEVCAVIGGVQQTLNRVIITDQNGGALVQQFIGPDGGPVTPDPGWTPGPCSQVTRDIEATAEAGCADGVPWTRMRRTVYNTVTGLEVAAGYTYFDSAGNAQTNAPTNFALGPCTPRVLGMTAEPGCVNGAPWTRYTRTLINPDNSLTTLQSYADSSGVELPGAPAGFTLGACAPNADMDTVILCDTANGDAPVIVSVVYDTNGDPTSTFYNLDGTPFAGNVTDLHPCGGGATEVNEVDLFETAPVTACFATGTPPNVTVTRYFTYERILFNNFTQAEVSRVRHWYDPVAGTDVTVVPAGTPVDCGQTEIQVVEGEEEGCAGTTPWSRRRTGFYTLQGQLISTVYTFVDSAGNEQSTAPAGFTLGACADVINDVETFTEMGCAGATPYSRRTTRLINRNTGATVSTAVEWIDSAGTIVGAAPAGWTLGECQDLDVSETVEPGCADGVPWTRITRTATNELADIDGTQVVYRNSAGTEQPAAPANFTLGECPACCPVVVGEFCLTGGQRGVAIRQPDGSLTYTNVNTGVAFNPAIDIVACSDGVTVRAQHVLLTANQTWPATGGPVVGSLVSVTFTVLTGTGSVTDSNGTTASPLPAGLSQTWSADPSASTLTGPNAITALAASTVYVAWVER